MGYFSFADSSKAILLARQDSFGFHDLQLLLLAEAAEGSSTWKRLESGALGSWVFLPLSFG